MEKKPKKHIIFKFLCVLVVINWAVGFIPGTDALLLITIPVTLWHFLYVVVDKSKTPIDQDSAWKDVMIQCGKHHKTPTQLMNILKNKYIVKNK